MSFASYGQLLTKASKLQLDQVAFVDTFSVVMSVLFAKPVITVFARFAGHLNP